MIHKTSCSFSELTLDMDYLAAILGFSDGILSEPFDQYVTEATQEAESLCIIQGAFYISGNVEFTATNSRILIEGREFGIGKTVARELRNATSAAFFICTAGKGISQRAQELLTGEHPVLGYIFDVLGSMIVEAATDLLQKKIRQIADSESLLITNRYSPGYCNWSVADQHKLFSFFPPNCCGISMTDSSLMNPIKSVSGIIGLGKEVKFREYTCDLCSQVDCFHRNHHRNKSKV